MRALETAATLFLPSSHGARIIFLQASPEQAGIFLVLRPIWVLVYWKGLVHEHDRDMHARFGFADALKWPQGATAPCPLKTADPFGRSEHEVLATDTMRLLLY